MKLIHIPRKQQEPIPTLQSFLCIPAGRYMWLGIIKSGVSAAPHCSAGRLLWTGNEQVVPDGGSEWNTTLFKGGKSFHQCRKTPKERFLPPPFPCGLQLRRHSSVFWSYMFMSMRSTHSRPALAKWFLWRARNKKCETKWCITSNCNCFSL